MGEHLDIQLSNFFSGTTFKVFADTLASGGIVKALCVPSGAEKFSNSALRNGEIYSEAIKSGAKGLPFLKVSDDGKEKSFFMFDEFGIPHSSVRVLIVSFSSYFKSI